MAQRGQQLFRQILRGKGQRARVDAGMAAEAWGLQYRLDGYYVEHLSFGMDVKCFFGTIRAVLDHDGVVEGGTGTLHEEENHKK